MRGREREINVDLPPTGSDGRVKNLNKKTNHKKKKQTASQHTNTPSEIILTMSVVKILKDSLANFEVLLLANANKSIPNLEFAHLTFKELKQKLTDMLELEEWGEVKSFDYNELWILYTSLAMYVVELQLSSVVDKSKLPVCLALRNQFNAIIDSNR
jgi:hypothetical protein